MLKSEDFTYLLPDHRIAKFPVEPRDSSKLLVFQSGEIKHESFKNIVDFLPQNAFLVFNDTKVIPARLHFKRATGAAIEVFLLNPVSPSNIVAEAMIQTHQCAWACMIGNRKKWKLNETLQGSLPNGLELSATLPNHDENVVRLTWNTESSFAEVLESFGKIPLPPYLNRETTLQDLETYQTVYSLNKGAVAAPTAGLHFTAETFQSLQKKGIDHAFVTLHVGAGTFQPIKVEDVKEHKMHNEQVLISKNTIEKMLDQKTIIPVGTTSMRTLESLFWFGVKIIKGLSNPFFIDKNLAYSLKNDLPDFQESFRALLDHLNNVNEEYIVGETEIFIYPGYDLKVCKGLITNFHQPESTLILLVAAIVGDHWRAIYDEALNQDYRFLSYGDSSLLFPKK